MSNTNKSGAGEIVVIRRKSADEVAAHKGGAWKIAYADFVTAMMAFFLVMWLINAANEATRAQVASYFNPIKLTDNATGGRGLNDPKETKSKSKTPGTSAEKATEAEKLQEQQALAEPAKTLDRIAGETAKPAGTASPRPSAATSDGMNDPFDPQAWQSLASNAQSTMPQSTTQGATPNAESRKPSAKVAAEALLASDQSLSDPLQGATTAPRADKTSASTKAAQISTKMPAPPPNSTFAEQAAAPPDVRGPSSDNHPPTSDVSASKMPGSTTHPAQQAAAPPVQQPPGDAEQLRVSAEIKAEILKKLNIDLGDLPANIDVKATPEGQLISLTDRTAFGMFQVGSSEPDQKLITMVMAIAQVIRERPGYLVIRGHTDSRPYHNRHYDNWQLSAARAQMTYYMLVRGGLDDSRVKRIEGLADRDPCIPAHPDAPENRRIEILLGQSS